MWYHSCSCTEPTFLWHLCGSDLQLNSCCHLPLPIKPKSRESDRLIPYFLSLAVSPFTAPCKLICFMKEVEWSRKEKEKQGRRLSGSPYPATQGRQWALASRCLLFINALLSSFPKDYFQLLSCRWIAFSPCVPESCISLNIFCRHLWFVSDLDLRTVGCRASSSQLWGISWPIKAYPWSFSLLQFTLIPAPSGSSHEGPGFENSGPENTEGREGIGLRWFRESLRIQATRI